MATDRQTPCLYYICARLCTKARKADHVFITASITIRVRYKNQKKENLKESESMKNIKKNFHTEGKMDHKKCIYQ